VKKTPENKDGRIRLIHEQLVRFTQLDFSLRLPVSEQGDDIDAIIVGLNTLGEELSAGEQFKKE